MNKRYLVVGTSRGIGCAVAEYLESIGNDIIAVSRSPSKFKHWIPADITTDEGIDSIVKHLDGSTIDGLLFMGGVWEENAFGHNYDFFASSRSEIRNLMAVNLIAPMLLAQAVAPHLFGSENAKIVMMGSTSGLDHACLNEVAYAASKFGLRGLCQSLGVALRPLNIGVSIVNPGTVATPEVIKDIALTKGSLNEVIPIDDVIHAVEFILKTSPNCTPQEINLFENMP